jgi:formylglycine-generating enzyme required for sulfatase activity
MRMSKSKIWLFLLALASVAGAWAGIEVWKKLEQNRLSSQDYEPPPPGMVFVPAGEFLMGSNDAWADEDEKPLRKVFLPAFYIDRCEVSNRRYKEFKKDHVYPPGEDDLPVTFVLKHEAEEYCRWAGRRLPTNAEWEKAARGTDGRIYPWGNEFKAGLCNVRATNSSGPMAPLCKLPSTNAASHSPFKLAGGSFPAGASPYGCQDMSGNVWEWVSDIWIDRNFLGWQQGGEQRGIIRGGAFNYSAFEARASHQGFEGLKATCHDVGFRCAMDAAPKRK